MIKYMISIKDTQDPTWEEAGPAAPVISTPPLPSEPMLPPAPGQPREPFDRHYRLLPPGADRRWIEACHLYRETYHVTIGSSADDAAYGPGLGERAVTAINPTW